MPIRKLAAILASDIVGYSRLMSFYEVGTLNTVKGIRRGLVDPAIAVHRGRLVKITGNGMLIEFASVFAPAQVPGVREEARSNDSIRAYSELTGAKAMAIHPAGGMFWKNGVDQLSAEEAALKAGKDATFRDARAPPCYNYARGNKVVLTKRLTVAEAAIGGAGAGGR